MTRGQKRFSKAAQGAGPCLLSPHPSPCTSTQRGRALFNPGSGHGCSRSWLTTILS